MLSIEGIDEHNPFFNAQFRVNVTLEDILKLEADGKATVVTHQDSFYDPAGIEMIYIYTSDSKPFIPHIPLYVTPETGRIYVNSKWLQGISKEEIRKIEDKILQRN